MGSFAASTRNQRRRKRCRAQQCHGRQPHPARRRGQAKATMADLRAAERATGYVAGGISPFGQKRAHPTVADETVELWETVYVSGGRRGVDVEIAPADLIEVTGAIVTDISR
ncbi:MAG TPA: YbaK/EbsC family protein [Nocardioides sp.]|nr:YbaK/EbsC family protein [Nocardioides sp.]